jgi:hypothetical protein
VKPRYETGDIVEGYSYLWRRQGSAGETEGRKPRPVCVAIAVTDAKGRTHLALLPISSQPPGDVADALPIPAAEQRRAGLADWKAAWVYVSEYNYDIAERSLYLPMKPPLKRFSARFMDRVLAAFRPTLQRKGRRVTRV